MRHIYVRAARAAAALATAAALALSAAAPVGAWTSADVRGRPGVVSVPQTVFGVTNILQPDGTYWTYFNFSQSRRVKVYRSPASSYAQRVAVRAVLQYWTGSNWANAYWKDSLVTIPRGSNAAYVPQIVRVIPNLPDTRGARGYWRVSYIASYSSTAGKAIGSRIIVSTAVAENICAQASMKCVQHPGFIYVDNAFPPA